MKVLLLCLLCVQTYGFVIEKPIQVQDQEFVIVHESYNEYGDKGIVMKLYKKGQKQDTLPVFSFTLENQSGGCGAQSFEDTAYEINGTTFIFYTHWERRGKTQSVPKGDRIQYYTMDANGTVHFKNGILHIEEGSNKKENSLEDIEAQYKGKFVQGKEAEALQKRVTDALREKKQTRWK